MSLQEDIAQIAVCEKDLQQYLLVLGIHKNSPAWREAYRVFEKRMKNATGDWRKDPT